MSAKEITKTDNDLSGGKNQIFKEMLEARVFCGHRSSKTNPKMKPYLSGTKNNFEIIDLVKTQELLGKSAVFLEGLGQQNKTLLFVGTSPMVRDLIKEAAEKTENCYVINHWIGGFMTNFKTIFGRLRYFRDLQDKSKKGELQKYTKKEQINFQKEIQNLSALFEGLERCEKLPEALVIVNPKMHEAALREAQKLNIPIVAMVDTDSDPGHISYPIPSSDHIRSSVSYILNKLVSSYNEGKKKVVATTNQNQ